MVVITRSQGHKIVEQMALRRAVQSVIFVIHADFLDSFLDAALYNNNLATSVQSLHIIFHRTFPPIPKLRQCLLAIRNVVDLELQLPRASAANWVRLLQGIRLPRLELLHTDCPPFSLAQFLNEHAAITHLNMSGRNYRGHDYYELANTRLSFLSEIEGPSSCVTSLVRDSPTSRVAAHCVNNADFALPLICLLSSLSTSTTALTVLQLDFDPTDYDLLRRIANAAPFVTTLKLVERSRSVSVRTFLLATITNKAHKLAPAGPNASSAPSLELLPPMGAGPRTTEVIASICA
ncbi:hypothetical protein SERLADRAFT_438797 [Serpula lacrymans var. lacrymans S7.9]|uniref:F-box domain-containing protein n=1 Tax=Serpula lacrymans var. lacrymans (strain S7.9) TaxID=578457 RepID=F8P0B6_SERL9|nr:uncharacterized protein SERLADRAFT_438797 [Serpula lacrymans var. lacrymans S7.9]EGO23489.1 hypothetical protein SERLADRAFT_438797 [Serpula lacrymans var. lacrymans S7.9]